MYSFVSFRGKTKWGCVTIILLYMEYGLGSYPALQLNNGLHFVELSTTTCEVWIHRQRILNCFIIFHLYFCIRRLLFKFIIFKAYSCLCNVNYRDRNVTVPCRYFFSRYFNMKRQWLAKTKSFVIFYISNRSNILHKFSIFLFTSGLVIRSFHIRVKTF